VEGPIALGGDVFDRRTVSYLSLSHGADRGIAWQTVFAGGQLGFARGEDDFNGLLEDVRDLKPTFFLGMAAFWSKLHGRYLETLHAALDEELCSMLLHHQHQHEHQQMGTTPPPPPPPQQVHGRNESGRVHAMRRSSPRWPQLRLAVVRTRRGGGVVKQHLDALRSQLGGCLRLVVTGGSRTPSNVREWMSWLLEEGNETRVVDSYGATEFPGISNNGVVNEGVEVRLLPVLSPTTGEVLYSPDDRPCPRGEILVRRCDGTRPSFYWKRPNLNRTAWDTAEGWWRTGDIGELEYRAFDACGSPLCQPNTHQRITPRCAHYSRRQDGGVPCKQSDGFPFSAGQPLLRLIDRVNVLEVRSSYTCTYR
jgi:long-subunit acyl-CoA synthetase (AMP-forming)